MPKKYVVTDDTGEVWSSAEAVREGAKLTHRTPKKQARSDAEAMTLQAAGTRFKAVPAKRLAKAKH